MVAGDGGDGGAGGRAGGRGAEHADDVDERLLMCVPSMRICMCTCMCFCATPFPTKLLRISGRDRWSFPVLHALDGRVCVHHACAAPTVHRCCRPFVKPRTRTQPELTLRRGQADVGQCAARLHRLHASSAPRPNRAPRLSSSSSSSSHARWRSSIDARRLEPCALRIPRLSASRRVCPLAHTAAALRACLL